MGTIYVAADPLGDGLRRGVVEHLQQNTQLTVVDLGAFDKYYEAAHKVLKQFHECVVPATSAEAPVQACWKDSSTSSSSSNDP
jgi:ribose 5-phosphate isomerase RpiB